MKGLLFILNIIFTCWMQSVIAQPTSEWVEFDGKVIDETLNSPIKATLKLESLPYCSDIRIFHSSKETGDFHSILKKK